MMMVMIESVWSVGILVNESQDFSILFIREVVEGVLEVEFGLCIFMLEPWLLMIMCKCGRIRVDSE